MRYRFFYVGPFRIWLGIFLQVWGLSVIMHFDFPRAFCVNFGPVFIKIEKVGG